MFKNNLLDQARPYRRKDSKTALVNSDLFFRLIVRSRSRPLSLYFRSYKKQKESKSKDRFLSVDTRFWISRFIANLICRF